MERGEGIESYLRSNLEEVMMESPKSAIRNPKEARSPKSEMDVRVWWVPSGFGFRISFGFRPSDVGFVLCS